MEWQSTRFDFQNEHWSETHEKWIPEVSMSVGGCISSLIKIWRRYKLARKRGEAYECEILEKRILKLQSEVLSKPRFNTASRCYESTRV